MRRIAAVLVATVAGAGAVSNATAASQSSVASATILIRHQVQHCHTWAVNGGPFRASQRLNLRRDGTITFINNDVMPHRLIELAGPRVAMRNGTAMAMGAGMHSAAAPGVMNHMGATTTIRLKTPGVYRFRTHAGEDYMAGLSTVGADNVLTLTVTVR